MISSALAALLRAEPSIRLQAGELFLAFIHTQSVGVAVLMIQIDRHGVFANSSQEVMVLTRIIRLLKRSRS